MERGEIYYVSIAPQTGCEIQAGRPAIIVSNHRSNATSDVLEVVYLTTRPKKDLPTHVRITSTGRDSTALCEQISSVSRSRFGNYVGYCSDEEMQLLERALMISLGIADLGTAPVTEDLPHNDGTSAEPSTAAELVRVEAERDIYKRMYEQMLEKVVSL